MSRDRRDPKLNGVARKNKCQRTGARGSLAFDRSNCELQREIEVFA